MASRTAGRFAAMAKQPSGPTDADFETSWMTFQSVKSMDQGEMEAASQEASKVLKVDWKRAATDGLKEAYMASARELMDTGAFSSVAAVTEFMTHFLARITIVMVASVSGQSWSNASANQTGVTRCETIFNQARIDESLRPSVLAALSIRYGASVEVRRRGSRYSSQKSTHKAFIAWLWFVIGVPAAAIPTKASRFLKETFGVTVQGNYALEALRDWGDIQDAVVAYNLSNEDLCLIAYAGQYIIANGRNGMRTDAETKARNAIMDSVERMKTRVGEAGQDRAARKALLVVEARLRVSIPED